MTEYEKFTGLLTAWFAQNGRTFPWRENREPYYVWVSEIMSQQTQIERVADGFFPRFIEAFPSVEALATAEWEQVYPLWEGLGYYSRGKNLLKAAKIIMEKKGGELPQTVEGWEALPGVGKYTAHAVMAFAHDALVPAIDTNITKITTILWPGEDSVTVAKKLVEASDSGYVWNSAMMDLSAQLRAGNSIEGELGKTYFSDPLVCEQFKPRRKKVKRKEVAKKDKGAKPQKRKHRIDVGIACIWRDGKYLIQARPKGKSFEGSWEFPGGKREKGENFRACVKREIQEEVGLNVSVRPHFFEMLHEFERTELLLRFHRCQIQAGEPKALEEQEIKWVSPDEFDNIDFLKTNHAALEKLKTMRV